MSKQQSSNHPWFLLYEGTSADGRGHPTFKKRTLDAQEAMRHWQECHSNPYSTGKVVIITDEKEALAGRDTDWAALSKQIGPAPSAN